MPAEEEAPRADAAVGAETHLWQSNEGAEGAGEREEDARGPAGRALVRPVVQCAHHYLDTARAHALILPAPPRPLPPHHPSLPSAPNRW